MNPNTYQHIHSLLREHAKRTPASKAVFYKTGAGHYAEHDQFIGVTVPTLRKVAKEFEALPTSEIQKLLESKVNEERFLALVILTNRYARGDDKEKENIYQFYMRNLKYVNNWNLVDASAHLIVGAHVLDKNKEILLSLSKSRVMWERRIAIVSTWYLIRDNQYEWTVKIAEMLLNDTHDLIHKAVGWMLREMGKKEQGVLVQFLDQHAHYMPRTMLRYAIEKFPEHERKEYLKIVHSSR